MFTRLLPFSLQVASSSSKKHSSLHQVFRKLSLFFGHNKQFGAIVEPLQYALTVNMSLDKTYYMKTSQIIPMFFSFVHVYDCYLWNTRLACRLMRYHYHQPRHMELLCTIHHPHTYHFLEYFHLFYTISDFLTSHHSWICNSISCLDRDLDEK